MWSAGTVNLTVKSPKVKRNSPLPKTDDFATLDIIIDGKPWVELSDYIGTIAIFGEMLANQNEHDFLHDY